jgi:hypothetical protein
VERLDFTQKDSVTISGGCGDCPYCGLSYTDYAAAAEPSACFTAEKPYLPCRSKYDVASRAELINTLLKNQSVE